MEGVRTCRPGSQGVKSLGVVVNSHRRRGRPPRSRSPPIVGPPKCSRDAVTAIPSTTDAPESLEVPVAVEDVVLSVAPAADPLVVCANGVAVAADECPVCRRSWRTCGGEGGAVEDDGEFICCDICNLWVHVACAGVAADVAAELPVYHCPNCMFVDDCPQLRPLMDLHRRHLPLYPSVIQVCPFVVVCSSPGSAFLSHLSVLVLLPWLHCTFRSTRCQCCDWE